MILVPFIPEHLQDLSLQPGQPEMAEYVDDPKYAEMLAELPNTQSMVEDGRVLVVGGLVDQGDGRSLAWALVSAHLSGTKMIKAVRIVKSVLENYDCRRIEAIVRYGFEEGKRFASLLGFECETPNGMVNWFKNGERAYLYARVKV